MIKRINPRSTEYAEYIFTHLSNVTRSWNDILKPYLQDHLDEWDITDKDIRYIGSIVGKHDESKWNPEEFNAYCNHWYPTEGFPDDEEAYDRAWLHHQHNNKHHWQAWLLVRDGSEIRPIDMDFEYICEMLCDWHSFSAKYDGNTAKEWYEEHGDEMLLSENTRQTVEDLLEAMTVSLSDLPDKGVDD